MSATLKNLLETALLPLGSTMYVYGGGWDPLDRGAGKSACSFGLSPAWRRFFEEQDASYDFREHLYERDNGLDCSGYVGWLLYQVLAEGRDRGYVMKAALMAQAFAEEGWGKWIPRCNMREHRPGDLMSTEGHVYLSLGECADGSVLLIHASPPGVMLSGTVTPQGEDASLAAALAKKILAEYYPQWYCRYPSCVRGISYLRDYDGMRWELRGKGVLTDEEGYAIMSAEKLMAALYGERSFGYEEGNASQKTESFRIADFGCGEA